ncbi:CPBP family intramembrane glutamic endopeptidase [Kaistella palustris]|uniref:CPBP family intramembrane glutamic endopeptidase n=1 Tax=Kaistella palustris TaxID=493376 RepID=UPI0012EB4A91|nr:CPBP family intramembrane glutamic endopeptidase [Kaistella palustris]
MKTVISFIVLFCMYHAAEYMLLFENSVAGFFIFQLLFFIAAWFLGNWQCKNGFTFWRLSLSKLKLRHFLLGTFLGITLYAVPLAISLYLGVEKVAKIPEGTEMLKLSAPFAFGVLFSSFSEDILTRATVFNFFEGKIKMRWIAVVSASVYLCNHIYRLADGWDTLSYIFLLGILFVIPLLLTKNLWITGFMHWSGNIFFYVTHNVIQTESNSQGLTSNQIFALWILLLIPGVYLLCLKLRLKFI